MTLPLCLVWFLSANIWATQPGRFERSINAPQHGVVTVSLTSGRVEIQSWPGASIYLIARRSPSPRAKPLPSLISTSLVPNGVKISSASSAADRCELFIFVPEGYSVDVQSLSGAVSIAGNVGNAQVHTQSGSVTVSVPSDLGASLDAKTISGRVETRMPVRISGDATANALSGTIGKGGRSISIDSKSGDILLLPQTVSELFDRPRTTQAATSAASSVRLPSASSENAPVQRSASDSDDDGVAATPNTNALRRPPVLNKTEASPVEHPETNRDERGSEVVRLESRLITLNVKVSDRSGRAISTLTKDDFLVYDDGVQQEAAFFAPVTAPIDLVLLLDLSGSIKEKRNVLKRAAIRFVDELSAADQVAVMTFTRRFQVVSGLTADRSLLRRRIEEINAGDGGTSFYDALWQTAGFLKSNASPRRQAIVVLTDGVDSSLDDFRDYQPEHPFGDALARVQESDATVYPIYLDTEKDVVEHRRLSTHAAYTTARGQLRQLADSTGGTLFYSARLEDLEGVHRKVISELHTLYSVSYSPTDPERDGRFHKVRVKMREPDLVAKTRPGYYTR